MTVDMDFAKQIASGLNEHLADVVPTQPRYVKLGYGSGQGRIVKDASKREVYFFEGDLGDLQRGQGSAYLPPGKGIELMDSKDQEGLEIEIRKSSGKNDRWEVYEVRAGSFSGTNGRLPSDQKGDLAALPTLARLDTLRPRPTVPASLSFTAPGTYYYLKPSTGERRVVHNVSGSVSTAVAALTSGQHQAAVLYLDTETGLSAVATATAVTAASALPSRNEFYDFTFADITIPSYGIPLANVYLYYSQTELTDADFYRGYDPRPLFASVSGSASSPLTTKGDVYTYSTTNARLPVGTNGQVLTADSGEATGLKWDTPSVSGGAIDISTDDTSVSVTADTAFVPNGWVADLGGGDAQLRPPYVDVPPASPDADDDEFPGTSLSGSWSWVNQGSAVATVSYSMVNLSIASDTAADRLRLLVKAAPSTPYAITVKAYKNSRPDEFGGPALIVRNSSSGKVLSMHLDQSSAGVRLDVTKWTNATTFSTSILNMTHYMKMLYMRIENDGTNVNFKISQDGVGFYQIATTTLADFVTSVDQIGFGYYGYDKGINVGFDYFRVS